MNLSFVLRVVLWFRTFIRDAEKGLAGFNQAIQFAFLALFQGVQFFMTPHERGSEANLTLSSSLSEAHFSYHALYVLEPSFQILLSR